MLLVIWLLAILSLMLGGLVGAVRQEARLGQWQREHTRAIWAAQAGLALAIQGLRDPRQERRWVADGRAQVSRFDEATLQTRVRSERGKLDLNVATEADLMRLAAGLGAAPVQARQLSMAMSAHRLQDSSPLRVIEEILPWPGMTPELYERLAPELTLWSGLSRPEPAFASAAMRQALGLAYADAVGSDPGPILTIHSVAVRPNGFSVTIYSTVLLSSEQSLRPFRVLRYSE